LHIPQAGVWKLKTEYFCSARTVDLKGAALYHSFAQQSYLEDNRSMFQLTLEKAAKDLLDAYFAENDRPEYIRLYVRPRKGSRGSRLALKPDAMGDRDLVLEEGAYKFLLSGHLAEQIGCWVKISANSKGGFEINSEKAFNLDR
jgi:hypothetical protein